MVDDIAHVVAEPEAVAAEPAAEVAPAVETAAETSIIESAAEPAAAEEAPAESAPAAEAAAETPAAEGDKPAEPPAAEAAAEAPAEVLPPSYEDFTFPEGITAAPEQIEAATGLFGKHHLDQAAAQEFIDLHSQTISKMQADMVQHQVDEFEQTKRGWRSEFAKEHGNQRDTVARAANEAVAIAFPKAEERQRIWEAFRATGAGDHPAMLNLLARLGSKLTERQAPLNPTPPRMAPDKATRRYNRNATP